MAYGARVLRRVFYGGEGGEFRQPVADLSEVGILL